MATVKAIYVGQGEGGTVFAGDFSSELQDIHAGTEVELTIVPVETTEAPAEGTDSSSAEGGAAPAEGTGATQ